MSATNPGLMFLDLPQEMRDEIYSMSFEPTYDGDNCQHIEVAILHVNKQTRVEATEVLWKKFYFVEVVTNIPTALQAVMQSAHVPVTIFDSSRTSTICFMQTVAQIHLTEPRPDSANVSLVFAGQPNAALKRFCTSLSSSRHRYTHFPRLRKNVNLQVTVRDPSGEGVFMDSITGMLREATLNSLWGYRNFFLHGPIRHETKQEIELRVRADRWTLSQDLMNELATFVIRAQAADSLGDLLQSRLHYVKGLKLCCTAMDCDQFPQLLAAWGPTLVTHINNIQFELLSKSALLSQRLAQQYSMNQMATRGYLLETIALSHEGLNLQQNPALQVPMWTSRQLALCKAKAHHLLEDHRQLNLAISTVAEAEALDRKLADNLVHIHEGLGSLSMAVGWGATGQLLLEDFARLARARAWIVIRQRELQEKMKRLRST